MRDFDFSVIAKIMGLRNSGFAKKYCRFAKCKDNFETWSKYSRNFFKRLQCFRNLREFSKKIVISKKTEFSKTQNHYYTFEIVQYRKFTKSRSTFLSCTREKRPSPHNEIDEEHNTKDLETRIIKDLDNLTEIDFN